MNVKELIYFRRTQLNLTLEDIAKHVGVSKSTVKKWESGYIKNMKRDKMALLSEILQISPMDLLNDDKTSSFTEKFFSKHELDLICDFRKLNEIGQNKALEYISDLSGNEQYQSDSVAKNDEKIS